MRTLLFSLSLSSVLLACASTPSPAPAPAVSEPTPAPESVTLMGSWVDVAGDSYTFLEDGSIEAPAILEGAKKAVIACTDAGFDIESCANPSFKWVGHPADNARYLLAFSMPMMDRVEENQELQCYCPPEPGLPFTAMLTEGRLVLNALQPNGAPVSGGEFTLTRPTEAPAP